MVRGRKLAASAPTRRARRKVPLPALGLDPPALAVALEIPFREATDRDEPRWSALLGPDLPLVVSALNAAHLELGLAVVVIARRLKPGIVCAHFVIDLLATGVTDCYGDAYGEPEFESYLADFDQRVPLDSCPAEVASRIVWDGARLGERNGVAQPESLAPWSRLLPAPAPGAAPIPYLSERADRPFAVAEILTPRPGGDDPWTGEDREMRCVVRVESRREH